MAVLMMATRVFIHGLESSSRGTKSRFFRMKYPDTIVEDYTGTLQQRMKQLNSVLSKQESLIIVGSSFGGLMAAIFALENPGKVKKLVLLSPALPFSEFEPYLQHRIQSPVTIYHGREDDVVPLAPAHEAAKRVFENLEFIAVDDDHRLTDTFRIIDWDNLLETDVEEDSERSRR